MLDEASGEAGDGVEDGDADDRGSRTDIALPSSVPSPYPMLA
jgi:hypothetical protein